MVKLQLLLIFMLIFTSCTIVTQTANAQDPIYHLEHEWVKIWINKDGTIDLIYDIKIACDSGVLHWVEVGQPNEDFTIGEAFDENNNQLSVTDTKSPGFPNGYKCSHVRDGMVA